MNSTDKLTFNILMQVQFLTMIILYLASEILSDWSKYSCNANHDDWPRPPEYADV